VPTAIAKITEAIAEGRISQEEIDARCRKLLHLKAWAGLDRDRPIELKNLYQDLNDGRARAMMNEVVASSMTLLTNRDSIVPLRGLSGQRIASLVVGDAGGTVFQRTLSRYAPIDHFTLQESFTESDAMALMTELKGYDRVIISIHGLNSKRVQNYGVTPLMLNLINGISENSKTIVNVFGNPYALARMPGLENADAVLFAFERNDVSEHYAAQAIFGGIGVSGTLPVTANRNFPLGMGLITAKIRMAYGVPEQVGMSSEGLTGIDSLVKKALDAKAAPGAQVLVAKDGMVVYEHTFGHHTYDPERAVEWNDVYDLASITKVTASLASFMTLVDSGQVAVDDKVSDHLLHLKLTNKKDITFRDMLAHMDTPATPLNRSA